MSNWISGKTILTTYQIRDFELFNYVKKGLQPHDDLGRPIPPPDKKSKISILETDLSEVHKKIDPYIPGKETEIVYPDGSKPTTVREFVLIDRARRKGFGGLGGISEEREIKQVEQMAREGKDRISCLEKKLLELEKDLSWKDYNLPEHEGNAKEVLEDLRGAIYRREDVQEFIIGPSFKQPTFNDLVLQAHPQLEKFKDKLSTKFNVQYGLTDSDEIKKIKAYITNEIKSNPESYGLIKLEYLEIQGLFTIPERQVDRIMKKLFQAIVKDILPHHPDKKNYEKLWKIYKELIARDKR